ncbi:PRC and DUF2382 domain-containing protein [Nocardiopsis ansamitocini]|uniref:Photosystem reaction center subunit H n=1 Tax=Nocardiopsis ansamitocini TaxID=1670832 RepID=A0A9W6P908_9ACTN|nr:PRC and DUF2382 domain-containing protein [Nocardiopsis ansamitocini]GLU49242.1 photosystem reaction center subunit H [Nocardiopsis ansamitocini]
MAPKLEVRELIDHRLLDREGSNVGKIGQVYFDDQTQTPRWVTVHTGFFGMHESFVPLEGAQAAGEDLMVPFDKDLIKDSPRFEAGRHLSRDEEAELYRHYGVRPSVPGQRADTEGGRHASGAPAGVKTADTEGMAETPGTAGIIDEERTGPAGTAGTDDMAAMPMAGAADMRDDAHMREDARMGEAARARESDYGDTFMTRSEEQAQVGVESRESGRAHVHKSVETEHFERDVPVTHEELRIEREPVTEADIAAADARIEADDQDIILHEERAVVSKKTVPVEKIRISKEQVTEEQRVQGELRKEHIEVERDDDEPGWRDGA